MGVLKAASAFYLWRHVFLCGFWKAFALERGRKVGSTIDTRLGFENRRMRVEGRLHFAPTGLRFNTGACRAQAVGLIHVRVRHGLAGFFQSLRALAFQSKPRMSSTVGGEFFVFFFAFLLRFFFSPWRPGACFCCAGQARCEDAPQRRATQSISGESGCGAGRSRVERGASQHARPAKKRHAWPP